MANEWMNLLPTAPVPADVAGSFLNARDAGSKYQQQAFQNAGSQFIQQAIQQATTNGQTDWDKVATIAGASPYAGMAQKYATDLLQDRVNTAYNAATKRALMQMFGINEGGMETPQAAPQGEQQEGQQASGVQASPGMQEQALDARQAALNASIANDDTGFATPEMKQQAQEAESGIRVSAPTVTQEGTSAHAAVVGGTFGGNLPTSPASADTVSAANAANRNWLGQASTMQPDPFFMLRTLNADGTIKQTTPADVNAMGKDSRAERVRDLQAKGLLAGNIDAGDYSAATNQAIASGMNKDSQNRIMGMLGKAFQSSPEDLPGNLLGTALSLPGAVAETSAAEGVGGRGIQSGRIGVLSGQVGLNAARTNLARANIGLAEDTLTYNNIQKAQQAGYSTVTDKAGLDRLNELTGNAAALSGSIESSTQLLLNPKKLNAMDGRQFSAEVTRELNPLLTAEGVSGVGATELFDQNFRPRKDLSQILQKHGMTASAAFSLSQQIAAPTRQEILSNIRELAQESQQTGVNAQKLKNMRGIGLNWANQPPVRKLGPKDFE